MSPASATIESLPESCTAFSDGNQLATGTVAQVASAIAARSEASHPIDIASILVFDDATGRVVDLDLRGVPAAITARYTPPPGPPTSSVGATENDPPTTAASPHRGPGRPRLGVVAREVTLLPRHWDWLAAQPGGASVALRKLVEHARREHVESDARRTAREAAYRVMYALAGDRPRFEDASRALFAGDASALDEAMTEWPADVGAYVRAMGAHRTGAT